MLRALDVEVVALKDELAPNTKDVDVFRHLRDSGYTFVTLDRRQLTRIAEASELRAAGISAIYIGPFWPSMQLWQQAAWLVQKWPLIHSVQLGLQKGSVVEVKRNGKSMLIPP